MLDLISLCKIRTFLFCLIITALACLSLYADSGIWQASDDRNTLWLHDITSRVETRQGTFSLSDSGYKLTTSQQPSNDSFDNNPWTVVDAEDTRGILDLRLYYRQNDEGRLAAKLWCKNRSSNPISIDRLVVVDGKRDGSWEGGRALQFGTGFAQLMEKDKPLRGEFATAVNKPSLTGGFLSSLHYKGVVTVIPVDNGLRVIAENPVDGLILQPDAEMESETIWLSPGSNPSVELERWADLAGKWNNIKPWKDNFAGWYSGSISPDVPEIADRLIPYGLKYINGQYDLTANKSLEGDISSYGRSLSKWFMNRRLIQYDTGSWSPTLHSEQWDRDWGSYLALTGYSMTIVDDIRNLNREQEKIMKRLLPALNSTGRPRDIWERDIPIVLEQSFSCGDEKWRVVGLFNWKDAAVNVKLNLDRLWDESKFPIQGKPAKQSDVGETDRRYLLFDFWHQRILGTYAGSADFELPAKSGKVIVVREAKDHPQILAIGEHIGQGAEELIDTQWSPQIQALTATTRGRRGIINTYVRLFIAPGWKIRSVAINGKSISWEEYLPDMYRFEVPDKDGPVTWTALFDGSPYKEDCTRPVNTGLIAETSVVSEDVKR